MIYDRPGKPDHPCVFCGKPGQTQRQVNLVTVDLCNDDYYNHSLGEVAAQLRNKDKQLVLDAMQAKTLATKKRKRRAKRRKEKHGTHPHS